MLLITEKHFFFKYYIQAAFYAALFRASAAFALRLDFFRTFMCDMKVTSSSCFCCFLFIVKGLFEVYRFF